MPFFQDSTFQTEFDIGGIQPSNPERFLPSIGYLPMLGGIVLLIAAGGGVALTSLLRYKVTVKAPAAIRPAGELRIVQAPIEGTINRISVEANQPVQQGDMIAIIEDSRSQTRKQQLEGAIQQTQQQVRQLQYQLAALAGQIDAEAEQSNRAIAEAHAELTLNQRSYQDKRMTSTAEVKEAEAAVDLAQDELARYQLLSGTGAISQMQVKEKQGALKTMQARLDRTKVALNPSTAPVEMAQEKMAQEQARKAAVLATITKERSQLRQKQVELQAQIDHDRKELQQVKTELEKTVIRAPISGVIQELTLRNPNQVVRSGERIAQIAPTRSPLRIKAVVAAQDIDKVKVGQPTQMRVSACAYPEYGTLSGKVSEIAPDTSIGAANRGNETTANQSSMGIHSMAYEVIIQPETLQLKLQNQDCPLRSGMEGSVEIITREETVLQFFLRKARLISAI